MSDLSTNCRPQERSSVKNDGNTMRGGFIPDVSMRCFLTEISNYEVMWLRHHDDSIQGDAKSEAST